MTSVGRGVPRDQEMLGCGVCMHTLGSEGRSVAVGGLLYFLLDLGLRDK